MRHLQSELSTLTAQVFSDEESISYRDTQLRNLRQENEKLKEDMKTYRKTGTKVRRNQ